MATTGLALNKHLLVQLAICASPPLPHGVGSTTFWEIRAYAPHVPPLKAFWSMGRTDTLRTSENVSTTKQRIEGRRGVGCRVGIGGCVVLFFTEIALHAEAAGKRSIHAFITHAANALTANLTPPRQTRKKFGRGTGTVE